MEKAFLVLPPRTSRKTVHSEILAINLKKARKALANMGYLIKTTRENNSIAFSPMFETQLLCKNAIESSKVQK